MWYGLMMIATLAATMAVVALLVVVVGDKVPGDLNVHWMRCNTRWAGLEDEIFTRWGKIIYGSWISQTCSSAVAVAIDSGINETKIKTENENRWGRIYHNRRALPWPKHMESIIILHEMAVRLNWIAAPGIWSGRPALMMLMEKECKSLQGTYVEWWEPSCLPLVVIRLTHGALSRVH